MLDRDNVEDTIDRFELLVKAGTESIIEQLEKMGYATDEKIYEVISNNMTATILTHMIGMVLF